MEVSLVIRRVVVIPMFFTGVFLAGNQEYMTSNSFAGSLSAIIEKIGDFWGEAESADAETPKAHLFRKGDPEQGFGGLLMAVPRCRSPALVEGYIPSTRFKVL